MPDRKLRVFLCHASQDKPVVRELYQRLLAEGWIDPWLDEEKLLPGQDWDIEIEKAVEAANAVIVCLSNNSVTKEGYIQKELRTVLDVAECKPEGVIFVIPLRLEDCTVPRRLKRYHYQDYFEDAEQAYMRLCTSLEQRAYSVGVDILGIKEKLCKEKESKAQEEEDKRIRKEFEERIRLEKQIRHRKQIEEQLRREAEEKEKERLAVDERKRKEAEELLRKRADERERKAREEKERRDKEEVERLVKERERVKALEQKDDNTGAQVLAWLVILVVGIWTWIEESLKSQGEKPSQAREIRDTQPRSPAVQTLDAPPSPKKDQGFGRSLWDFLSNAALFFGKVAIWAISVYGITVFVVMALSWFSLQRIELSWVNWVPLAYAGLSLLILKTLQYLYINRFVGESGDMVFWSVALYTCQFMLLSTSDVIRVLSILLIVLLVFIYSPEMRRSGCLWPLFLLGGVAGFYKYFALDLSDPFWLILSNEFLFVFSGVFARGKD